MKQLKQILCVVIIYFFIVGIVYMVTNISREGAGHHNYIKAMQGVIVGYESNEAGVVVALQELETDKLEYFQFIEDSICLEEVTDIIENRKYVDTVISISYYEEKESLAYTVYLAQIVPEEMLQESTE